MTAVIVAIILFLVFLLFRKFLPISSTAAKTDKPVKELRVKYRKPDLIQLGLFILTVPVLTFLYFKIFAMIYNFRLSLYADAEIIVGFQYAFVLIAMFAAMVTGSILLTYFAKRRLKHDWGEYSAYNNLKYGFDYNRIGQVTIKVIAGITIVLFVAIFDWFTVFRNDDIVINNLFGLGSKSYNYTDISEIRNVLKTKAPNGNVVEDEHYVIIFMDGEKWNSRYSGFANFQTNSKIIELIQERTGKDLIELEFDRD